MKAGRFAGQPGTHVAGRGTHGFLRTPGTTRQLSDLHVAGSPPSVGVLLVSSCRSIEIRRVVGESAKVGYVCGQPITSVAGGSTVTGATHAGARRRVSARPSGSVEFCSLLFPDKSDLTIGGGCLSEERSLGNRLCSLGPCHHLVRCQSRATFQRSQSPHPRCLKHQKTPLLITSQ